MNMLPRPFNKALQRSLTAVELYRYDLPLTGQAMAEIENEAYERGADDGFDDGYEAGVDARTDSR